jgi:hypothetical protein
MRVDQRRDLGGANPGDHVVGLKHHDQVRAGQLR